MENILKFFPFMPDKDDVSKLVIAIIFYLFVPGTIGSIVSILLTLTIVLAPLGIALASALGMYSLAGIAFAVIKFLGIELK